MFFCQSTKSHPQIATFCWQISWWWRQGHWQSVPLVPLRAAPRRVVPVVDALKIGEKDRKSAGLNFWFAIFRHDIFDMSVLMLIWFNMLMCFSFSEVLCCDVYLFFFSDCVHHQFSIKTMPTRNQSRRSWLASDSSDAFLCLSQRIHEQFADVFGAYSGFYAGIKCLISYQGATMDWAASADQNGTSRANQCLAEKLRISGCKSTILFERLHSNVKIGWPSKPRIFCTGLNSLYLRIVIPPRESLYSVHKPILGLWPSPTNATRTGFPLGFPACHPLNC